MFLKPQRTQFSRSFFDKMQIFRRKGKERMLIIPNLFFVEELQRNGLDVTYTDLEQMYAKSRLRNLEAVEKERRDTKRA